MRLDELFRRVAAGGVVDRRWQWSPSLARQAVFLGDGGADCVLPPERRQELGGR